MLHKSFTLLETKADGDTGEFTALVSTFNGVDHVGDRILPGAYAKTLAQWRRSNDPLPIILAHQWDDVMAHVGYADPQDLVETPRGLQVKGKLDVEDNPVARQVHKLMKRRTLREFSIGYSVPEGGERRAKDGANEISEIDLFECGPCLKGIDPRTELREVKSALGVEGPPSEADLRRASDRADRDIRAQGLPDVPPSEGEPAQEPKNEPDPDAPPQQEPPASEEDLRRASDRVDRDLRAERLPSPTPTASPAPSAEELQAQLDAARAELGELKIARSPQVRLGLPPAETATHDGPSVEELAARLEAAETELKVLKEGAFEPQSEAELRKASERLDRELKAADLPEPVAQPSLEQQLAETREREATARNQAKQLRDILMAGKRLSSDLREQLDAAGARRYRSADEETYVYVEDFDPDQGYVIYWLSESRRFVRVSYTLNAGTVTLGDDEIEVVRTISYRPLGSEVVKSEQEGTGQEDRPVDPLRKRSYETVLEIESDGVSRRKPPREVKQERAVKVADEDDLKRRSREAMLQILNGS